MSSRRSSGSEPRRRAAVHAWLLGAAIWGTLVPLLAAPLPQSAPTTPGSPPWYEAYQRAVADAELENWEGVAAKIDQALKLNAKSERNVRTYGMWHASYIPYYYLGIAQYHMGKGADALKSLQKEEAAGVVQHDPVAYLKLRKISDAIESGKSPETATASASPAPASPPPAAKPATAASTKADALVGGLQAFFQGNYDRSISLFQEEMKKTTGDDLTLHLYLGMAYAGKASEQPGQKEIWRNLAILEFQRVHALDPKYTLASGVFSEEMVVLFNEAQKKK